MERQVFTSKVNGAFVLAGYVEMLLELSWEKHCIARGRRAGPHMVCALNEEIVDVDDVSMPVNLVVVHFGETVQHNTAAFQRGEREPIRCIGHPGRMGA